MNAFQDEQGKEVDLSLIDENIEVDNDASGHDSISRMLASYHQCMNSSEITSECSEDEFDVSDVEEHFEKTVRKKSRLDMLKQKYNDLKDGKFDFDNNFVKTFADLPVKRENNIDFNTMTPEQYFEFMSCLEADVRKKEEEVPSLIAENVKNNLDKVKNSIGQIMNETAKLEFKERVSDDTRLMNILNLSKSVVNVMKSIDVKVQKAKESINTLKLYSNLKKDKK